MVALAVAMLTILSAVGISSFSYTASIEPITTRTALKNSRDASVLKETDGGICRIAGRRCILSPRRRPPPSGHGPDIPLPPLVLIGGTAQTVHSWEHHLPALSLDRDVLVYECLGQGPAPPDPTLPQGGCYRDVSLPFHADDFASVVGEAFPSEICVDVAGFSFGGRVALAAAVSWPGLIRRLHLTGVASSRDDYAEVVVASWRDLLMQGLKDRDVSATAIERMGDAVRLRAFAWSALMATHSDGFLARQGPGRLQMWVDNIIQQNTVEGLSALLEQTHLSDGDVWHPASMARRIAKNSDANIVGRICIGSLDRMSTVEEANHLAILLGWNDITVFNDCGHAVPTEQARHWRNDLLEFLKCEV